MRKIIATGFEAQRKGVSITRRIGVPILGLIALMVGSNIALADHLTANHDLYGADQKIYAGTFCQSNSAIRYYWGRALNDSSVRSTFECPVVRDSRGFTNGALYGHASVIDRHPSSDVKCTLSSLVDWTSNAAGRFTSASSTGSAAGPQELSFDELYAWRDGHYVVVCYVPGRASGAQSGVVSYEVREIARCDLGEGYCGS